jgi:hypothetical protein
MMVTCALLRLTLALGGVLAVSGTTSTISDDDFDKLTADDIDDDDPSFAVKNEFRIVPQPDYPKFDINLSTKYGIDIAYEPGKDAVRVCKPPLRQLIVSVMVWLCASLSNHVVYELMPQLLDILNRRCSGKQLRLSRLPTIVYGATSRIPGAQRKRCAYTIMHTHSDAAWLS